MPLAPFQQQERSLKSYFGASGSTSDQVSAWEDEEGPIMGWGKCKKKKKGGGTQVFLTPQILSLRRLPNLKC